MRRKSLPLPVGIQPTAALGIGAGAGQRLAEGAVPAGRVDANRPALPGGGFGQGPCMAPVFGPPDRPGLPGDAGPAQRPFRLQAEALGAVPPCRRQG